MSIKVGPLDLLEANDLCVEGQGTPHVRDNDGNVVHTPNEISHATPWNLWIPMKGEVLVTGIDSRDGISFRKRTKNITRLTKALQVISTAAAAAGKGFQEPNPSPSQSTAQQEYHEDTQAQGHDAIQRVHLD